MTWAHQESLESALDSDAGKAVPADTENFAAGGAVLLIGQEDQPA